MRRGCGRGTFRLPHYWGHSATRMTHKKCGVSPDSINLGLKMLQTKRPPATLTTDEKVKNNGV